MGDIESREAAARAAARSDEEVESTPDFANV
jgi:hypothetical protein